MGFVTLSNTETLVFRENRQRHWVLAKLALVVFAIFAGMVIVVTLSGGQAGNWIGFIAGASFIFAIVNVLLYVVDPVGRTLCISGDRLICRSRFPDIEDPTELLFEDIRRIQLRYPSEDQEEGLIVLTPKRTYTLPTKYFEVELLDLAELLVERLRSRGRRVEEETFLLSKHVSGYKVEKPI